MCGWFQWLPGYLSGWYVINWSLLLAVLWLRSLTAQSSDSHCLLHTAAGSKIRVGLEEKLGTECFSVYYFFIKRFRVWNVYLLLRSAGCWFPLGQVPQVSGALMACRTVPQEAWSGGLWTTREYLVLPSHSMALPACFFFLEVWSTCCLMSLLKCQFGTFWLTDTHASTTTVKVLNTFPPASFLLPSISLSWVLPVTTAVLPGPQVSGNRIISVCSFSNYCSW